MVAALCACFGTGHLASAAPCEGAGDGSCEGADTAVLLQKRVEVAESVEIVEEDKVDADDQEDILEEEDDEDESEEEDEALQVASVPKHRCASEGESCACTGMVYFGRKFE